MGKHLRLLAHGEKKFYKISIRVTFNLSSKAESTHNSYSNTSNLTKNTTSSNSR